MTIKTADVSIDQRGVRYASLLLLAFLWISGCASHNSQALLPTIPDVPSAGWGLSTTIEAAQPGDAVVPEAVLADALPIQVAATVTEKAADDTFDPFAQPGEEGIEEYDPWESVNTKVFEFNRQVDRWVLKPVSKGYNFVVPNLVQIGISNVFYNVRFPQRFLNNIFQGKLKGAGIEAGRFLVNSTAGVGGFFDVAEYLDLRTPEEDTGQTLGFYGVKPGPYLIVPFLQPFTVRDLVGYVADIFMNPLNWLVAPIIEVNNVPSVIPHKNRTTTTFVQLGARVFEIVNDRSLNLEKFQGVEEATLDLYTAVRNAYLQRRAKAIQE